MILLTSAYFFKHRNLMSIPATSVADVFYPTFYLVNVDKYYC